MPKHTSNRTADRPRLYAYAVVDTRKDGAASVESIHLSRGMARMVIAMYETDDRQHLRVRRASVVMFES